MSICHILNCTIERTQGTVRRTQRKLDIKMLHHVSARVRTALSTGPALTTNLSTAVGNVAGACCRANVRSSRPPPSSKLSIVRLLFSQSGTSIAPPSARCFATAAGVWLPRNTAARFAATAGKRAHAAMVAGAGVGAAASMWWIGSEVSVEDYSAEAESATFDAAALAANSDQGSTRGKSSSVNQETWIDFLSNRMWAAWMLGGKIVGALALFFFLRE